MSSGLVRVYKLTSGAVFFTINKIYGKPSSPTISQFCTLKHSNVLSCMASIWLKYSSSMDSVWRVYETCTINLGSNSSIVSQGQDVSNNL